MDKNTYTSLELYKALEAQNSKILNQYYCDIEPEFMGFVLTYKNLSELIPQDWTVIDIGCSYAPQSYYFKDHKSYIGIDLGDVERYTFKNSIYIISDVMDFVETLLPTMNLDLKKTFVICNYVPEWGRINKKELREIFDNLYFFYPCI